MMNKQIGLRVGMKGEYRAILHNPEEGIKYDTGWKPNTILDQGFGFMCMATTSLMKAAWLGDSAAPVDVTQTGAQGTVYNYPGNFSSDAAAPVSSLNGGAPNYESINTYSYTWNAGAGTTGPINEFGFAGYAFNDTVPGNPYTHGTIRVVLDTTINKGIQDYLTIEHRLTHYPELNDITGVINISGVAYNYLLRGTALDVKVNRPIDCTWHDWAHQSGDTDDMTDHFGAGPTVDSLDYASCVNAYFPSGLTSYTEGTITAAAPTWVKDIRCMTLYNVGMGHIYQIRIGKVSDDTPHEKLNTHEFTIGIRMYPQRYTP